MKWTVIRTLLLSLLAWIVKLWTPKTSDEKKETKLETLAKEIEILTEKCDEAQKKWRVAVANGTPDHDNLWVKWLSASTDLSRAECEHERLGGKIADIH